MCSLNRYHFVLFLWILCLFFSIVTVHSEWLLISFYGSCSASIYPARFQSCCGSLSVSMGPDLLFHLFISSLSRNPWSVLVVHSALFLWILQCPCTVVALVMWILSFFWWILLCSCGSCSYSVNPATILWILLCSYRSCYIRIMPALWLWILHCSCGSSCVTVDPALIRWHLPCRLCSVHMDPALLLRILFCSRGSCSDSLDSSLLLWHRSTPEDRALFLWTVLSSLWINFCSWGSCSDSVEPALNLGFIYI